MRVREGLGLVRVRVRVRVRVGDIFMVRVVDRANFENSSGSE